jgi:hypothetical protein
MAADDLQPLQIRPGLFTLETDRGAAGRWKDGDHVRFYKGLPEKIGGWQKVGANTFTGICRALIAWISLVFQKLIGLGTHLKLQVWDGGAYYNITPLRDSGTLGADPFTTSAGLTTVTVTDVGHGLLAGDYVVFDGAATFNGVTIDGEYTVTTVIDADNYQITHTVAASGSGAGGGAVVTYEYEIHIGAADSVPGYGWGAGAWGSGTWGTARSATTFLNMARIWSLDNWGEDLIACPRGLAIYVWDRSAGVTTRATRITQAPETARAIFVSGENRQIVALGAHDGVADDPMLVRWCDAEDYTNWTPEETNTAGEKRLDQGNELYCGIKGKRETLIFSDTFVWSMTFDGPPYNFGWTPLGFNGSIRGPNAAAEYNGRIYWMGAKEFYRYDGSIRVLPCDVLNHVMDDINTEQSAKVFAGVNRKHGEVWWLYPSEGSTEIDRYVTLNVEEDSWSFGTIVRTAYNGELRVFGYPFATGTDGYLYDHELGTDADGAALESFLESGDVEIGSGDKMMLLKMVVPDFKRLTGSVDLTVKSRRYPQDAEQLSEATGTISSSTKFLNPRIKGRQVALRIDSDAVGDDWRMGQNRVKAVAYGRK